MNTVSASVFALLVGAMCSACSSGRSTETETAGSEAEGALTLDDMRGSLLALGFEKTGSTEFQRDVPSFPIYGITFTRGPEGPGASGGIYAYNVIAASGASERVIVDRFEHPDGRLAFATKYGVAGPVQRGRYLFDPKPKSQVPWGTSAGRLAVDIADASFDNGGMHIKLEVAVPSETGYLPKNAKTSLLENANTSDMVIVARGVDGRFRPSAESEVLSGVGFWGNAPPKQIKLNLAFEGGRLSAVTLANDGQTDFEARAPEVRTDRNEDLFESVYSSKIVKGTYRLPVKRRDACSTDEVAVIRLVGTGMGIKPQNRKACGKVDAVIEAGGLLSGHAIRFPWEVALSRTANGDLSGSYDHAGETYRLMLLTDERGLPRTLLLSPKSGLSGSYGGWSDDCAATRDEGCFDERFYLGKYPDVAQAVAGGAFTSGRHHYERHGRSEGRQACP